MQVYSINTLGGYWSAPYLSQNIRHKAQPEYRLRQFIDVKENVGKSRGDTWLFDKSQDVNTAGGTLVETNTIPETNFVTNQGTGSITEYGNSVPFTAKLQTLGQFEISPMTEQKLRDDQVKVLESAAGAQFVATEFLAVCVTTASVNISTTGTASATATADLNAFNTRQIVDFMKKRNIPKYDGSKFVCVASVSSMSGFHGDTAAGGWAEISKHTQGFAKNLFAGEVGEWYMTRFVEETGYLSNTIGNGSTRGQAVIFGADVVYEAVSIPEEIRVKQSADYGRDLGLAWYALLGFKKVWDFAVDGEQHIVFVTSL